MITKRVTLHNGNVQLGEVDLSQALDQHFRISPENNLREDVERMVEWLQTNPLGAGTKLLTPTSNSVKHAGRQIKRRRFAPDQSPGFRVSTWNRFYRVVYGIVGYDGLVLFDILPHDEFDKKYSSS